MSTIKSALIFLTCLLLANCVSNKQDDRNIFTKIGDESLASGNSESAIHFYDKALQIDPKSMNPRIGKVESLIFMNSLDAALNEIEIGLGQFNKCEELLYLKGKVFLLKGDISRARDIFNSLPNNYKALNALGTICDAEFDHELARQFYRKAISINGQYADAIGNLGLSLALSTDKIYEAIGYLERANSMQGASSIQKNNLALAYGISGNFEKAKIIYEETLSPAETRLKISQIKKMLSDRR